MTTPVRASGRDLRALAAIVSENRADLPDGEGLPPSLLADLTSQIRCDRLAFLGNDSDRHVVWFWQEDPLSVPDIGADLFQATHQAFWLHYRDDRPCSYPERTGDLRSIIKISDFYSAREQHSTGTYTDCDRPLGIEHVLMLCLPAAQPPATAAGRHVRMYFMRGPGPDFSERDRALLTLLRPHLQQAYLDVERHRRPVPRLTPRQAELLHLVAAGHTNSQIARRLGISEATVRTHLENVFEKLGVSSRTAAVTRVLADRIA